MKTLIRFLLGSLALAASAWAVLPAADTPPGATGRVLVLENDRALEGDIRCEGGQFCVRRTVGEVWLPGDKVLKLCGSWEEAFAFVRAQANLRDPDERLRLARWCQLYGLREQALEEATAAAQMRPTHAASRQLLAMLQRPAPAAPPPAAPPSPPVPAAAPAPAVELSAESLAMFTTRVQPVLLNTCASCHASGKATTFSLTRAAGTSTASRRATQQNLTAVLAQIDPARPHASPLLLRAVTDHGKSGQAPLRAQSPPHRILQEWVHLTLAGNPFLREQRWTPPEPPSGGRQAPEGAPPPGAHAARSGEAMTTRAPVISRPASPAANPDPPAATAPVAPVDDFDPALFNRQISTPRP